MAAGRKIEVQLVGDAGDLERSLAGALASLKAFGDGAKKSGKDNDTLTKSVKDGERGLIDFDKAATKLKGTLSGGPLGLFSALGNAGAGLLRLGGFAQSGEKALGDLATSAGEGEGAMSKLGTTLTGLAPVLGAAVSGFALLGAGLLVLPALFAAVTFVAVALLDVLTTLTAIAAALVGPLALLAGLLGGLGAAFALSFEKATKGVGAFKDFGGQVSRLGGMFAHLVTTLGVDFLPLFDRLVGAAQKAIFYFDRLAKMPLEQAFRNLATHGVALLSQFVYGVANVLKRPFKLAIELAFGSGGGDNAQRAITNWWDSLSRYLFGYTATHKLKVNGHIISIDKNQVEGALQPILNWFKHQNSFVTAGIEMTNDIIHGLQRNKSFEGAVRRIASHAGTVAAHAFDAALTYEISNAIPRLFHAFTGAAQRFSVAANAAIKNQLTSAFNAVKSAASGVWNRIKGWFTSTLNISVDFSGILATAKRIWNQVKSFVESPLSVSISWPSPPSWLHSLGNLVPSLPHTGGVISSFGLRTMATGGMVTGGIPGRDSVPALLTPGEMVLTTGQQSRLLHGGAGGGGETHLHFNFPNAVIVDGQTVKRAVTMIMPEIRRQQARRA